MTISRRDFMKGLGAVSAAAFVAPGVANAVGAESEPNAIGFDKLLNHRILSDGQTGFPDSPVVASDGKAVTWAVWVTRFPDGGEVIHVSENHGDWSIPSAITPVPTAIESPLLACAPGARPMAVWVETDGKQWILNSSYYLDGKFGEPKSVGSGVGRAANPSLAAGADGSFWLAWESYSKGKFRVCLKQWTAGKWGKAIAVTRGKNNAYDPAVAADASGTVWVAYSAAENAERNVYLTSFDAKAGKQGAIVPIAVGGKTTARPMVNSHPSVHCDTDGGVWVAYQHCGPGGRMPAYHGMMHCSVVRHKDGKLQQVVTRDSNHTGKLVFSEKNDQYPTLIADTQGSLWLFTRGWIEGGRTWTVRASRLDAAGWTQPVDLLDGQQIGRLAEPAVAAVGSSFCIAWQSDDFLSKSFLQLSVIKSEIRTARIAASLPEPGAAAFEPADPGQPNKVRPGRARVARRKVKIDGEEFTLLFGNLHEHTNASRCWPDGSDGTFDDNYRQGIEVEGYDFVGLTDHGFDLYPSIWRRNLRTAGFYNDPRVS